MERPPSSYRLLTFLLQRPYPRHQGFRHADSGPTASVADLTAQGPKDGGHRAVVIERRRIAGTMETFGQRRKKKQVIPIVFAVHVREGREDAMMELFALDQVVVDAATWPGRTVRAQDSTLDEEQRRRVISSALRADQRTVLPDDVELASAIPGNTHAGLYARDHVMWRGPRDLAGHVISMS